jgi:hypothetical protein
MFGGFGDDGGGHCLNGRLGRGFGKQTSQQKSREGRISVGKSEWTHTKEKES